MSIKLLDKKRFHEASKEADDLWSPGYGDDHLRKCKSFHEVPLKIATEENLRGLADKVTNYDSTNVVILPWQTNGRRQVLPGTGIQAGVTSGEFLYQWHDDFCIAKNNAVGDMYIMVTGRLPSNVSPVKRSHVLAREANYHPDGSQLFWPVNGDAFVVLLAPPGDDVTPEDFQAFYCDGSFGLNIHPSVWHQPLYPVGDKAGYISKQSATYACVGFDSVDEFGKFLKIPLLPELAQ